MLAALMISVLTFTLLFAFLLLLQCIECNALQSVAQRLRAARSSSDIEDNSHAR